MQCPLTPTAPCPLAAGVGEYWALFPRSSSRGLTLSNALSAISCGAALGAYFAGERVHGAQQGAGKAWDVVCACHGNSGWGT